MKPWLLDLVHFQGREEVDPRTLMRQKHADAKATPSEEPDISADDVFLMMERALHNLYANWADKPLPALNNKTPRQAIANAKRAGAGEGDDSQL